MQYDFSNLTQFLTFFNATWYRNNSNQIAEQNHCGGYYTDILMAETGMTTDEVNTLYNISITTSLGTYVMNFARDVSIHYGCINQNNCTADEIAQKQWGQSLITNSPLNADPVYTPKQLTCYDWGDYPSYACLHAPPEYKYWAFKKGLNE